MNKRHKKLWISLISVLSAVVVIFVACAIYVGTYYRADDEAKQVFATQQSYNVTKSKKMTVFEPQSATCGFIFYPGGKVEDAAYAPLMAQFAKRGVLCVLVKMPLNLAVLKIGAADGIQEQFPNIHNWIIGGHSLGGAMAAYYIADNADSFCGLALLGAYSSKDLSSLDIKVACVYGSEDRVMNAKKYKEDLKNLPESMYELVIAGGCHSYFGSYGMQKGDGTPAIARDKQMAQTAEFVIEKLF